MDARQILWGDDGAYRPRYERTATALIAVQHALRKRHPLNGAEDEFLELYAGLAAADPEIFTEIWEDPASYFWARRAYELIGSCLKPGELSYDLRRYCEEIGAVDPLEALRLHLEDFKRFILALEILTGGSRRFARPFNAQLPLSIPGTPYSMIGTGRAEIVAIASHTVHVLHEGRTIALTPDAPPHDARAPRVITRPSILRANLAVTFKPETFVLPGIHQGNALRKVPEEFQREHLALIEQAMALVERHQPEMLRQFGELIKVIALKPPACGDYSNLSVSDLPGAFILSIVEDPYWIADSLIHEFFHNRLFFITEEEPIFVEAEADQDADEPGEFYSPWRLDLRPLSGVFHALYVFIGTCKFWFSVWQSRETSGLRRAYAEDQSVRWLSTLKIGVHQLRAQAHFTEFGARLFDAMENEVAALSSVSSSLGLSYAAPAMLIRPNGDIVVGGTDDSGQPLSIIKTIRSHQERYDLHHQCPDIDEILDL